MGLFHRSRRRSNALDQLLEELGLLGTDGNGHARAMARRVRDGEVEQCLGEVAELAASGATAARLTPVAASFVRFEQATTGVDLAPRGRDLVRQREVDALPQHVLAEAMQRRDAALARVVENQRARTLRALRQGA